MTNPRSDEPEHSVSGGKIFGELEAKPIGQLDLLFTPYDRSEFIY